MMIVPLEWKIGVAASMGVAVCGTIGWLMVARANLRAEVAQARAEIVLCRSANDEWAAKAEVLAAAATKKRAEAEARAGEALRIREKAERMAQKHTAEADAITGRSFEGEACVAAKALMTDYLKRRR